MSGEQLDVYLRAHTEKVVEKSSTRRKKEKKHPDRWPERVLIWDTETRTDIHQKLLFGIFRICKLEGDRYICEREGIIYSGETNDAALNSAAVLEKTELNAIGNFVLNTYADIEVKRFPPHVRLEVYQSFPSFMQRVFWPAVRRGYGCVGFNLPFDISRISLGWSRSRKGGFSLIMSRWFDPKKQRWVPNSFRPHIVIEAKDAKTAFISRTSVRKRARHEWSNPGRFLDIYTVLYSLFDKHMGLDAWCAYFQKLGYEIQSRTVTHTPRGRVEKDELMQCREDVKITHQLLNAAMQEFSRHPLPNLLPDKCYSPAGISTGYMREMGIVPPMEKFRVANEINGIAMQAYYGGRSECHIRRVPVPVMRLDFTSCYCTTNTLLHNWDVLTAASVEFPDATDEIRHFIDTITHEKCFDPAIWPQFRFFALVQPDRDIFPVRAAYKTREPDKLNIGLNYLTSEQPIWFAGPDIIASILLNGGKIPKILKAIRVLPVGKQDGLRAVYLLDKVRCDPAVDDFYKLTVEQKQTATDETLKKGLKCIGNAGAYGPLVRLDNDLVQFRRHSNRLKQKISLNPRLDVYSGEHFHQQNAPREIEVPGPFYLPPLAALITSGSRLLLAMAQKCVEDAGAPLLFCDTDSVCCTANDKGTPVKVYSRDEIINPHECAPIPCLSRKAVLEISQRFTSLNPYSFKGTILKSEDVNYEPSKKYPKGDPSKPRDLWGYAISAKRYCLGEGRHFRKLVDAKGHGIGWLASPLKRETDEDQFAVEFWQKVLRNERVSLKSTEPHWLDLPAMMKLTISSPAVIGRVKDFCKPYDFVLAPVVRDGSAELDEQADKPILITQFNKDSRAWLNAEYFNVRTGNPCRITVDHSSRNKNVIPVRSYRDVLNAYVLNPEKKFNGPSSRPCGFGTRGVLQRKHVIAQKHKYCGKEVKRKLESGPIDHNLDAKVTIYENGRVAADPSLLQRIVTLQLSERAIAKGTKLHRKPVHLFCSGKYVRRETARQIIEFVAQHENVK